MNEKIKCKYCNHEFVKYEHYIELKDGTILCETCFFNIAVEHYNAIEKQNI